MSRKSVAVGTGAIALRPLVDIFNPYTQGRTTEKERTASPRDAGERGERCPRKPKFWERAAKSTWLEALSFDSMIFLSRFNVQYVYVTTSYRYRGGKRAVRI